MALYGLEKYSSCMHKFLYVLLPYNIGFNLIIPYISCFIHASTSVVYSSAAWFPAD